MPNKTSQSTQTRPTRNPGLLNCCILDTQSAWPVSEVVCAVARRRGRSSLSLTLSSEGNVLLYSSPHPPLFTATADTSPFYFSGAPLPALFADALSASEATTEIA